MAISVRFTPDDVNAVVLDMAGDLAEKIVERKIPTPDMEKADRAIIDVLIRLLSIADDAGQLAYMGKHLQWEMIFYALYGTCGRQFLQSIITIRQAEEIYEVNSWIKENFKETFSVEELAKQKNMSVSVFHQKFKALLVWSRYNVKNDCA